MRLIRHLKAPRLLTMDYKKMCLRDGDTVYKIFDQNKFKSDNSSIEILWGQNYLQFNIKYKIFKIISTFEIFK